MSRRQGRGGRGPRDRQGGPSDRRDPRDSGSRDARGRGPSRAADRSTDGRRAIAVPDGFPEEGQVVYGRQAVHELLRAGRRGVHALWATGAALAAEPWLGGPSRNDTATRATGSGKDVPASPPGAPRPREVDAAALTELLGTGEHQGVAAAADPYPYAALEDLLDVDAPLLVALDEVQDPQNVGAIARTAEVVGATGLLLCRHRAATITPAVAKASAGAVEHLPVAIVRNLADTLAEAQAAGCWVYGAAGDETATAYDAPDYTGGVVLVMGAEGAGLRPRVAGACDALVALPVRGRIASLNVASAASALLYEILQQRTRLDSGT